MVGKPVIRATRIPAELIVDWRSGNLDLDAFFAAYPDLTINDVQAALAIGRDAVRADYLHSRQRREALAAARQRSRSNEADRGLAESSDGTSSILPSVT